MKTSVLSAAALTVALSTTSCSDPKLVQDEHDTTVASTSDSENKAIAHWPESVSSKISNCLKQYGEKKGEEEICPQM